MSYEAHELSLAFPNMSEDQYSRLVDDIRRNGLIHEITLYEGKILDGRHRYKACGDAGVEPTFTTYTGDDPVAFVSSENAARRHMTQSQLAHAVAGMKDYEERKARERQAATQIKNGEAPRSGPNGPDRESGRTTEILAAKVGVGVTTIKRAIHVREKGTPELNAAVASGEITVNQADKIAQFKPATQNRIVETPKAQRSHELQNTFNRSRVAVKRERGQLGMPVQPATSFVRKVLSGLESLATICAEEKVKTAGEIADKFIAEMEWDHPALLAQFERGEVVFRALAIVVQHANRKAA